MAGPWDDYAAQPAPQPAAGNGPWTQYQPPQPISGEVGDAITHQSGFGRILDAFGAGLKEGWGSDPVGLSPETEAEAKRVGLFNGPDHPWTIYRAFNEAALRPAAAAMDVARRSVGAVAGGVVGAANAVNPTVGSMAEAATDPGLAESLQGLGPPGALAGGAVGVLQKLFRSPIERVLKAQELGVITPEYSAAGDVVAPKPVETPAPAPAAAMPAESPEDVLRQATSSTVDKAGNIRLDNMNAPEDVKQAFRDIADENGGFMHVRGPMSDAQLEQAANALGLEPSTFEPKRPDDVPAEVWAKAVTKLSTQANTEFVAAKKAFALSGSDEDATAYAEAKARAQMIQEEFSKVTYSGGRTLAALKKEPAEALADQSVSDFLNNATGSTKDELLNEARLPDPQSVEEAANLLQKMRQPKWSDYMLSFWRNQVLSGFATHTTYTGSNAIFALADAGIETPLAAAIGKLHGGDKVMLGEGPARLWGIVNGTPRAVVAAARSIKAGIPSSVPGVFNEGSKPIVGPIFGAPQHVIVGIHTLFSHLGYYSEVEAQSYRQAAKEGLSPSDAAFWTRRAYLARNPSEATMDAAAANGDRVTFTQELGPIGKKFQAAVRSNPVTQFIVPFTQVPTNLFKAVEERTPLAFLDKEFRDNLLGRNGNVARDTQIARMVTGSALGAMAVNWALNGNTTGGGPSDPKERAEWLLTHKPYSIKIGGQWVDYHKLGGTYGMLFGLGADLADVGGLVSQEKYAEGASRLSKAASNMVLDASFMQGLSNIVEAVNDPDRKGAAYLTNLGSSFLPASSFLRQAASMSDPDMREAKTFIDQLKYETPGLRNTLLPIRDWTGTPVANDRAGFGAFLGMRAVNTDPVDAEMQRLDINPTKPEARIGGVKLTPEQYDRYQSTAGPLTRQALEMLVRDPSWQQMPDFMRKEMIENSIRTSRRMGAAFMQMDSEAHATPDQPGLITQGIRQRIQQIKGVEK